MSNVSNLENSTKPSAPMLLTDAEIAAVSGGSIFGDILGAIGDGLVAVGTLLHNVAKMM